MGLGSTVVVKAGRDPLIRVIGTSGIDMIRHLFRLLCLRLAGAPSFAGTIIVEMDFIASSGEPVHRHFGYFMTTGDVINVTDDEIFAMRVMVDPPLRLHD